MRIKGDGHSSGTGNQGGSSYQGYNPGSQSGYQPGNQSGSPYQGYQPGGRNSYQPGGQNSYQPGGQSSYQPAGMPSGTSPVGPAPRKKGKKVGTILGICAGAAVILLVGGYFVYTTINSPKKRIIKAYHNTYSDEYIEESNPWDEVAGFDEMKKKSDEGGFSLEVSSSEVSGDAVDIPGTFTLKIDKDTKAQKASAVLTAESEDGKTGGLTLLTDGKKTYLTSDGLLDGYYTVDNATAIQDAENSSYNTDDYHVENPKNLNEYYFPEDTNTLEDLKEDIGFQTDEFWDNVTDISRGKSENITIGEENPKADVYNLEIKKDYANKIAGNTLKSLKENSAFEEALKDWKEGEDLFTTNQLLSIYVYENRIAGYQVKYQIEDTNQQGSLAVWNQGKENLLSRVLLQAEEGSDSVSLLVANEKTSDGIDSSFSLEVPSADTSMDFNISWKEESKEVSFDGGVRTTEPAKEEVKLSGSGTAEIQKEEGFTLNLEKLSLSYSGNENGAGELTSKADITYQAGASSEVVEADSSKDTMDFFQSDSDSLSQFLVDHLDTSGEDNLIMQYFTGQYSDSDTDLPVPEEEPTEETEDATVSESDSDLGDLDPESSYRWLDENVTDEPTQEGGWDENGEYTMTIDSVVKTDKRAASLNSDVPDDSVVYEITYSYSNQSYTDPDGIFDGVYLTPDYGMRNDQGDYGTLYSMADEVYPEEVPVGESTTAKCYVAFPSEGPFTIFFSFWNNENEKQQIAKWHLTPQD